MDPNETRQTKARAIVERITLTTKDMCCDVKILAPLEGKESANALGGCHGVCEVRIYVGCVVSH